MASSRYRVCGLVAASILVLDQATKWLVVREVPRWYTHELIPGLLNLVHVRNKGAAFGIMNTPDAGFSQQTFFMAATAVALVAMLGLLATAKRPARNEALAIGGIMGGALGNLVDRARLGEVVDFLDLHVGAWHWPAFNVADMGITLGAAWMVLTLLKKR